LIIDTHIRLDVPRSKEDLNFFRAVGIELLVHIDCAKYMVWGKSK
jgi:hypothetical protein